MNKSESIKNVVAALVKFNKEVTTISKDAKNPFLKNDYATLDQIVLQIRPILSSHGLIVMQDISNNDDISVVNVKTSVMHESGEFIQSSGTTLKLSKVDAQGAGAGITYARRYDLSAMLSLNTGEDDDGNSVSGKQTNNSTPTKEEPKKQYKSKPKPETITMTQKTELEKKSKEFAKLRNQTVDKVIEALNISDLNLITKSYATKSIETLDGWLKKASESNVPKEDVQETPPIKK